MKTKPLIISAAVAAAVITSLAFHAATRSPADTRPPSPGISKQNPTTETVNLTETRHEKPSRTQRISPQRPLTENNLGISSIDLIAAREIADQMAATLERDLTHVPDSIDSRSSRAIDSPSQKLGLRLGLDAATMEKLDEILAADRAEEIERRIAAEKSRTAHTRELLESDRDNYVSYLALQSMLSRGLPLSNEQQAFLKQFPQAPEPAPENPEWHEKPDLVDAMRRHLSAEQDAELTRFLDERKARDQERRTMHAYMRSGTIADHLGLDETERTTLYQHLRQNPDASTSELSEILSPELRTLLPPGL